LKETTELFHFGFLFLLRLAVQEISDSKDKDKEQIGPSNKVSKGREAGEKIG